MTRSTSHLPDQPYSRTLIRHDSQDAKLEGDMHLSTGKRVPSRTGRIASLGVAVWPLFGHAILMALIASLIIFYVDGKSFNLDGRRLQGSLADGSRFRLSKWVLLQSDVTTLVSVFLSILRLVVAAWVGPLVWRCAFILMETAGLRAEQLHRMVSYTIPSSPRTGPLHSALWVVLVLTLPVCFVAPVLTGSITWAPSYNVITAPAGSAISVPDVSQGRRWSDWTGEGWAGNDFWRAQIARQAVGLANIAWGRGSPDGSSKRVLASSVNIPVNSTLNNVTLPYFEISALEWISNPDAVLTPAKLNVRNTVCTNVTLSQGTPCPLLFERGAMAFIEDAPYSWDSTLPSSSVVSQTQLLALYGAWRDNWKAPCSPDYFSMRISDVFPPNATFYPDSLLGQCWLFARVTYKAGVGSCINCRISSYTTVQADDTNPLQNIRGDHMASTALTMMPTVIGTLTAMNVSVPSAWNNVDHYVAEFLRRSYAVSWTAVTNFVGELDPQLDTAYRVALPASQARVNKERVYVWFGVQALVTLSGLLFLLVQASLTTPMLKDTALAAFYLDSSEVYEPGRREHLQDGALIRIRYEDGHMKTKVE